jgi:hypothetical protein
VLHFCVFSATNSDLLCDSLEIIYKRHADNPPFILIGGDFNYPSIDWNQCVASSASSGQCLLRVLDDFHLQQLVLEPTRYCATTLSTLDLLISSHPALVSEVVVGNEFSDHCLIKCTVSRQVLSQLNSSRRIFQYDKGNFDQIRSDLKRFSVSFFANDPGSQTVDDNWLKFKHAVTKTVNENVPTRLISSNKRRPSWLTVAIQKCIKRRDRLAKIAKKAGTQIAHDRYRKVRNQVTAAINKSYLEHLNKIVGNVAEDPRSFYRFIKSKKTDSVGIPPLSTPLGLLLNDYDKANALNKYFNSVFTREDLNAIPWSRSKYPAMPDFTVTEAGVIKLLSNLNVKKAVGPDEISPRILREARLEIASVLTFIFNQSLNDGQIPDDWLIANIFALHKKGATDQPENYRPISLTSVVSKVMEHIVHSSVSNFLESRSIISPRQHGFRPGHSCETQLILAIDDWAKALDDGFPTDIAIFDFSKAFDSVPHQRLISKLSSFGIRSKTLQWITAFLSGRRQRVVINGSKSEWLPVTSGVPQGTVLGPLLFLLYINDITAEISSEIRMFADDCILYRQIKSHSDRLALQNDIDSMLNWSLKWQMQYNSKKCHILQISRQRKNNNLSHYHYHLGQDILTQVDSYPYLGVTVSSDLRWNNHINNISLKATRTLNFIRRNIYGCTVEAKALAYTALVRPHLEYASAAWDPHTAVNINRLEAVQHRAARFVKRDYRRTTSMSGILKDLDWPQLCDRRRHSRLNLFYKAYHNLSAITLSALQRPTRNTRSSSRGNTFTEISTRIDSYKYSFFPRTVADWNKLPAAVREKPTADSFRIGLHSLYC